MIRNVPQEALKGTIAAAVDLSRFEYKARQDILKQMKTLEQQLIADLAGVKNLTAFSEAKLKQLLSTTQSAIASAYDGIAKEQAAMLTSLAIVQQKTAEGVINNSVGTVLIENTFTHNQLKVLASNALIEGAPSAEWWARASKDLQEKFADGIRQGMLRGETLGQLVERVQGPLMGKTTAQAEAIVRTSVQTVSNMIRQDVYKENSDIVEGIQWVSTLDDRTTDICQALDGAIWDLNLDPVDDGPDYPGAIAHWGCRSTQVPVLKSWNKIVENKELAEKLEEAEAKNPGMRASMDGEVPAKMDYNEWLMTLPKERQIDILGPGKWELWEGGGGNLSLREMIDQSGNTLTLKELEDRGVTLERKAQEERLAAQRAQAQADAMMELYDLEQQALKEMSQMTPSQLQQALHNGGPPALKEYQLTVAQQKAIGTYKKPELSEKQQKWLENQQKKATKAASQGEGSKFYQQQVKYAASKNISEEELKLYKQWVDTTPEGAAFQAAWEAGPEGVYKDTWKGWGRAARAARKAKAGPWGDFAPLPELATQAEKAKFQQAIGAKPYTAEDLYADISKPYKGVIFDAETDKLLKTWGYTEQEMKEFKDYWFGTVSDTSPGGPEDWFKEIKFAKANQLGPWDADFLEKQMQVPGTKKAVVPDSTKTAEGLTYVPEVQGVKMSKWEQTGIPKKLFMETQEYSQKTYGYKVQIPQNWLYDEAANTPEKLWKSLNKSFHEAKGQLSAAQQQAAAAAEQAKLAAKYGPAQQDAAVPDSFINKFTVADESNYETVWGKRYRDRMLTDKEYDKVVAYTGNSYAEWNAELRAAAAAGRPIGRYEGAVQLMDSALAKFAADEDMLLFRGVKNHVANPYLKIVEREGLKGLLGRVIHEPAFSSTSIKQGVATSWAGSDGMVLKILTPKGSKGAYVNPISNHRNEKEFILPRNVNFQIVKAEWHVGSGGHRQLHVTVLLIPK